MRRKVLAIASSVSIVAVLVLGSMFLINGTIRPTFALAATYAGEADSEPALLSVLRTNGATVTIVTDVSALDASKGGAFIFNGSWLRARASNQHLRSFMGDALRLSVITAAVGDTSALFEIIQSIRGGVYAPGRNPAYYNPPLAAYWTTPDGMDHIRIVDSRDATVQAESLTRWVG